MNAPRASIPVLRFCAGLQHLGVAAEDVTAIVPARAGIVHIATVLGMQPATDRRDCRVIRLTAPPDMQLESPEVEFLADVPVDVVRCHTDDILPLSPGIPPKCWKPIMGFARINEQTVLLLDIPSVVEALAARRDGEQS